LVTFKRDFEKIFGATPRKWLLEKRLQEAQYLLEKGKKRRMSILIWVLKIFLIFNLLSKNNMAFRQANYKKTVST
jgi:AraC-like DNA-binding protein